MLKEPDFFAQVASPIRSMVWYIELHLYTIKIYKQMVWNVELHENHTNQPNVVQYAIHGIFNVI